MDAIRRAGEDPYVVGRIETEKGSSIMLRVVVLVSGGGTNLQAVIDKIESGEIPDTKIVGVISNNPGAYALERAKAHGIQGKCVSPKSFADRALLMKVSWRKWMRSGRI